MTTKLPTKGSDNDGDRIRGLCFKTQWEPCLQVLRPEQYQHLMPEDIEGEKIQNQTINMERAAFYYTRAALKAISASKVDGFHEHHRKLYRVLRKVSEQGSTTLLRSHKTEWLQADDEEISRFLQTVKNADDCGSYLSLQKGYAICSRWIGQYLSHQDPAMRILEIGAGTGSPTLPFLQSLSSQQRLPPRFEHFFFTDISAGFFECAKERLNAWNDRVTYKILNIEEDPIKQGFDDGSFDLIVSSNVLHATANMDKTLRNARAS